MYIYIYMYTPVYIYIFYVYTYEIPLKPSLYSSLSSALLGTPKVQSPVAGLGASKRSHRRPRRKSYAAAGPMEFDVDICFGDVLANKSTYT